MPEELTLMRVESDDLRDKLSRHETSKRAGLSRNALRMDVVILDEPGCLPFSQAGGTLLFHLPSKLYEHTSVVVTNLSFAACSNVFGDAKMSTALLDRLTHRCHSVATGDESYRFQHFGSARWVNFRSAPTRGLGPFYLYIAR